MMRLIRFHLLLHRLRLLPQTGVVGARDNAVPVADLG